MAAEMIVTMTQAQLRELVREAVREELRQQTDNANSELPAGTKYVTVQQAARHLNVTDMTIRNYIHSGKLPALRVDGGGYRVPREALADLQASAGVQVNRRRAKTLK